MLSGSESDSSLVTYDAEYAITDEQLSKLCSLHNGSPVTPGTTNPASQGDTTTGGNDQSTQTPTSSGSTTTGQTHTDNQTHTATDGHNSSSNQSNSNGSSTHD